MKTTPLHAIHEASGAKMGEFAGYDMPLYYGDGVLKEHEWVREHAGAFDVSHMGQLLLFGAGSDQVLERLTPSNFRDAKNHTAKYTVMTNPEGGIVDDLIVTRLSPNIFYIVINAGNKERNLQWMRQHVSASTEIMELSDRALVAVQGPLAETVLQREFGLDLTQLGYMQLMEGMIEGANVFISRLGYTGEDGFEISIPDFKAEAFWGRLMQNPEIKPIGLAARDSLRLEMGYCLYGHDIDASTTPIEAGLRWVMRKDDKTYIGADRIGLPKRRRVGLKLTDKGIAREGAQILDPQGNAIGAVTSGTFSPTLKHGIAMGYVDIMSAATGTQVMITVRGNNLAATVVDMPFVPPRTKAMKK